MCPKVLEMIHALADEEEVKEPIVKGMYDALEVNSNDIRVISEYLTVTLDQVDNLDTCSPNDG